MRSIEHSKRPPGITTPEYDQRRDGARAHAEKPAPGILWTFVSDRVDRCLLLTTGRLERAWVTEGSDLRGPGMSEVPQHEHVEESQHGYTRSVAAAQGNEGSERRPLPETARMSSHPCFLVCRPRATPSQFLTHHAGVLKCSIGAEEVTSE